MDGLRVEKGEGLEVGKEGRIRGGKRGKGYRCEKGRLRVEKGMGKGGRGKDVLKVGRRGRG